MTEAQSSKGGSLGRAAFPFCREKPLIASALWIEHEPRTASPGTGPPHPCLRARPVGLLLPRLQAESTRGEAVGKRDGKERGRSCLPPGAWGGGGEGRIRTSRTGSVCSSGGDRDGREHDSVHVPMTWLLLLTMLLAVAALTADVAARKAAVAIGLPRGGIRYVDTCGTPIPCESSVPARY